MKKLLLLFPVFLFALSGSAQRASPDVEQTNEGELKIQPVLHGTLVLEWKDEVIYFDPYGGEKAFEGIKAPTIIYITDIHGDHLHTKTLSAINTENAIFVVPEAVAEIIPSKYREQLIVIKNGETKLINEVMTIAMPMYNLPESSDSRHTKGRGNGYILSLGRKNVYISGDTEDIPEMRGLNDIDIAFICMNLPYTMDIRQAASAVLEFKPGIVYPFHYRGEGGLSDVESFKKLVLEGDKSIEVRLRNWYPEY